MSCSEGIHRTDTLLSVRQTQELEKPTLPVLREALPKTLNAKDASSSD